MVTFLKDRCGSFHHRLSFKLPTAFSVLHSLDLLPQNMAKTTHLVKSLPPRAARSFLVVIAVTGGCVWLVNATSQSTQDALIS
jgi:hypothetical protein